jgi:hypothetical protein
MSAMPFCRPPLLAFDFVVARCSTPRKTSPQRTSRPSTAPVNFYRCVA